MHNDYGDIRSRISDEPLWFDDNGVPRYEAFSPMMLPCIYATQAALLEIKCQGCQRKFMVGIGNGFLPPTVLRKDELHYGDPPLHGCIGDTMNSMPLQVHEFWERSKMEWERVPNEEGPCGGSDE